MLTLPADVIRVMRAHAAAWYPSECCGLLFARSGSDAVVRALPMDNLADKLHERNPEDFPHTGRDFFALNERQAARHAEEAGSRQERWAGIFHSHIDCGCYFSAEDQASAAPDGVPVDPTAWHVVMECRQGKVVAARAYRWDGAGYPGIDLPGFAEAP